MRNSVKVVIDAYNGSMTFYVIDPKDPIIKAYQKAFPKLFSPRSQMSAELRAHLRYPEDLFRVQTNMFGRYHITDPNEFYNKADAWDIAQDPGSGQVGAGGAITQTTNAQGRRSHQAAHGPDLSLLTPAGRTEAESFLILQPFVPSSRTTSSRT